MPSPPSAGCWSCARSGLSKFPVTVALPANASSLQPVSLLRASNDVPDPSGIADVAAPSLFFALISALKLKPYLAQPSLETLPANDAPSNFGF